MASFLVQLAHNLRSIPIHIKSTATLLFFIANIFFADVSVVAISIPTRVWEVLPRLPQYVDGATCHVLNNELWVVSAYQAQVLPLWNVKKWREVPLGGKRVGVDATTAVINQQLHVFTSEDSSFTHTGEGASMLVLQRGLFRSSWGWASIPSKAMGGTYGASNGHTGTLQNGTVLVHCGGTTRSKQPSTLGSGCKATKFNSVFSDETTADCFVVENEHGDVYTMRRLNSSLPAPVTGGCHGSDGSRLVIAGGTPRETLWRGPVATDQVRMLRSVNSTWETLHTKLSSPRAYAAGALYEDTLLCAGGVSATPAPLASLELINVATGTVAVGPKLPGPGFGGCLAVHQGYVYYIPGWRASLTGTWVFGNNQAYRARLSEVLGSVGANTQGNSELATHGGRGNQSGDDAIGDLNYNKGDPGDDDSSADADDGLVSIGGLLPDPATVVGRPQREQAELEESQRQHRSAWYWAGEQWISGAHVAGGVGPSKVQIYIGGRVGSEKEGTQFGGDPQAGDGWVRQPGSGEQRRAPPVETSDAHVGPAHGDLAAPYRPADYSGVPDQDISLEPAISPATLPATPPPAQPPSMGSPPQLSAPAPTPTEPKATKHGWPDVEWIVLCCFAGGEYNSGAIWATVALVVGLGLLVGLGVGAWARRPGDGVRQRTAGGRPLRVVQWEVESLLGQQEDECGQVEDLQVKAPPQGDRLSLESVVQSKAGDS